MGEALNCALCPDPIAPGTNHATLPDGQMAHPWCDFQGRQHKEAASRAAHLPGCLCDEEICPAPRTEVSDFVRKLRRAFAPPAGPAGGTRWAAVWWTPESRRLPPDHPGRWAHHPEIFHSELANDPSRAFSDLPGKVPGALVRAQTPCVTGDLGEREPEDIWRGLHGAYLCRLGHRHHGRSPFGRGDIPEDVRQRISASLGEEAPRG
jgi:hypothetical protein